MKKIIILISLVFMAFLTLYSQYFNYSQVLSFNISPETRSVFADNFSLIILTLFILIYGEIIQKLTKKEFKKNYI